MSYVEENLMPNEKVLFSGRVHPAIFISSAIMVFVTLGVFVLGLSYSGSGGGSDSSFPQSSGTQLIGSFFLCVSAFFFLYSVLLGLQAFIIMFTTEFAVTNRRVIAKTGFIRRHTLEMLLSKIESVSVKQGILGRLLNFGTVTVTGTGGTRESFRAIGDPIGVRKNINKIIEAYVQFQQKL
jgi:uncharacterized membrane protein YdbT with pleckstrin-like domain